MTHKIFSRSLKFRTVAIVLLIVFSTFELMAHLRGAFNRAVHPPSYTYRASGEALNSNRSFNAASPSISGSKTQANAWSSKSTNSSDWTNSTTIKAPKKIIVAPIVPQSKTLTPPRKTPELKTSTASPTTHKTTKGKSTVYPKAVVKDKYGKTILLDKKINNVNVARIIRKTEKGKGYFGLGTGTHAEALSAGKSWVGKGHTTSKNGKIWISSNRLRQFRLPSFKPKLGKQQANFESRSIPAGQWENNGHLDIK